MTRFPCLQETCADTKDSAVLFVLKHLIVAMETLMRGQDEIHEAQMHAQAAAAVHTTMAQQQLDMQHHLVAIDSKSTTFSKVPSLVV